ncbi:general secretion pathway protein GspC [Pseudomonas gingeri]|uniref:general secretion pathway protein GspC n=1 Tax=Pseudomonas gingeri TaxID=117681 RepID=UPI0015A29A66|nr:general secretion pathway protein GspC [Pseudomonas gingeri]NVZ24757.1 general secretion pathway protein GspC [Pseudomonas gingeri]NWA05633.1 general secretion pathway protein GspC [Pseudomonas gingeri]
MQWTPRFSQPQIVQSVGLLAALAGAVVWSTLLLTPAVSQVPEGQSPGAVVRSDNPALQWFSNQPAQLDIKVSGVMAGVRGAVAILSLNDGPPRSFLAGERLGQGVKLLAIEGDGILIERGTEKLHLTVTRLSEAPFLPKLTRP